MIILLTFVGLVALKVNHADLIVSLAYIPVNFARSLLILEPLPHVFSRKEVPTGPAGLLIREGKTRYPFQSGKSHPARSLCFCPLTFRDHRRPLRLLESDTLQRVSL